MNYGGPAIILLRPQLPENIGTAARAMLNFGLNDLRLVNPRETWPNDKAVSSSAGAIDILSDDLKFSDNSFSQNNIFLVNFFSRNILVVYFFRKHFLVNLFS